MTYKRINKKTGKEELIGKVGRPIILQLGEVEITQMTKNNILYQPKVQDKIKYCGGCGIIVELSKDGKKDSRGIWHHRECGQQLRYKPNISSHSKLGRLRKQIKAQMDSQPIC